MSIYVRCTILIDVNEKLEVKNEFSDLVNFIQFSNCINSKLIKWCAEVYKVNLLRKTWHS